jgi:hypothetical protein
MTMTIAVAITITDLFIPNFPILSEVWCYGEVGSVFR